MVNLDWSHQEVAIAAALSGDEDLLAIAATSDPYIVVSRMAGRVPEGATKETHPHERALAKTCLLGFNYGQGPRGLAARIESTVSEAADLQWRLSRMFPTFMRWSANVTDLARQRGYLKTRFGWRVRVGPETRETSLRNFLNQASGAELMQIAACLASEAGVVIAAPVHDAFLLEGPIETIGNSVATMRSAMDEASRTVLNGFVVPIDETITAWPAGYHVDTDDAAMWERILGILEQVEVRT